MGRPPPGSRQPALAAHAARPLATARRTARAPLRPPALGRPRRRPRPAGRRADAGSALAFRRCLDSRRGSPLPVRAEAPRLARSPCAERGALRHPRAARAVPCALRDRARTSLTLRAPASTGTIRPHPHGRREASSSQEVSRSRWRLFGGRTRHRPAPQTGASDVPVRSRAMRARAGVRPRRREAPRSSAFTGSRAAGRSPSTVSAALGRMAPAG
jgi:hypothetical protein